MNEARFRELISGRERGIRASMGRACLSGLSCVYGLGTYLRRCAYDWGCRTVHKAQVPVISVGNITAGGTGKTPFVAYLASWFRERDVCVGILSRGYRALPAQVNDEKLVLDRLCPDVPHLQNPNRSESARLACEQHGCQLLILDDGFQHRRLARDLDIVLIDALNPWGYGHLLPRGLLREPISSLARADLVVVTRADQASAASRRQFVDEVKRFHSNAFCVEVGFQPHRLVNSAGEAQHLSTLPGKRIVAFCGVGNPESFRQTLAGVRAVVAEFRTFADHHHYSAEDFVTLQDSARRNAVDAILTTQKDLVKIDRTQLAGCPLWAVEIGTQVISGQQLLEQRLCNVLELLSCAVTTV